MSFNHLKYTSNLERARRIERPTLTLARLCSTPELRPQSKLVGVYGPARPRFLVMGKAAPSPLFAAENRLALGDEGGERFLVIGAAPEHGKLLRAHSGRFLGRKIGRALRGALGRFHRKRCAARN